MERKSVYIYDAKQNETAYIAIEPIKVGPLVVASDNGAAPPQTGPQGSPLFEIHLQEQPDFTHYVLLDFTFPPGTADDAEYRIKISDNSGNEWDDIPPVNNHILRKQLKFNVVS
jgi:hypothetical protein